MPSVTLVDGTDLTAWANRRDAQQVLPQLLRRLVHATVGRVIRVGFPAGEGVQLGGWDGVVAVEQGNAFVPDGASAWELSTNQDFRGKADSDYEKRLVDPRGIEPVQSNFVFVTPRRWGRKDEWAAGRRREGVWRDVRAYDADDLEAWLELAPAVHVWISILLGKHPEDALDLRSFWADWSEATRPATTPELILAGRREVVERVHAWLREPPVPLALQAEDRAEALAVFAASIERLPVEERVAHLSRALVVHTLPAWHRLTASPEALILAMVFESSEALARATRGGHRVIIPLGRADSASAATVTVPRLSRDEATTALVALGIPEDRARDLATLARRGIMSFRRRLAVGPEMQQPQWARPEAARSLLPALFAGAWNAANEGDRQAVAALAQVPYEEVTDRFIRWSSEPDPPVRRVGDAWSVTSKEDAWSLLARYLTRDDLERFAGVLLDILGTPDPRFDLPEDQRWMAEARGHSPRHSGLLREGVADTLAVMGTRGDTILLAAGLSARDRADHIARRLLERANGDWRLWASLAHVLPLLAEAAPDAFLDGVEGGLGGAEPVLLRMFARPDGDWVFSSSPHTGLLWALETVAWSPEHLGRVAMVLARLARLDPGGTLANRPQNSLCEIYLLWHPQTTASLEQRLRVLDALRGREPDVAWRLLSQLLPEQHGIAHNTARPRWRDWAPDSLPPVTVGEYWRAVREVVGRMVSDAAESGARWQDLIEALHRLPADLHDTIVDRLMRMDLERLHPADRTSIWGGLRKLISRHRSFSDAAWALPPDRIDRLEEAWRRFEPEEPAARYRWLFGHDPELPEGLEQDWDARQEAIARARRAAVHAIHAQAGVAGLLDLARQVERPDELGVTLGQSDLLEMEEDGLLAEQLAGADAVIAQFARGFTAGRVWSRGRAWGEAKLAGVGAAWSPAQRAELLACLPRDGQTWDLAERTDPETERRYWHKLHLFGIAPDMPGLVERAARKFLEHGRPYAAIDLLGASVRREALRPGLVAEALERALQMDPEADLPLSHFGIHVASLLRLLEGSAEVDESRIAALEWGFLPLLERHERTPTLLHRELARSPRFFGQIVSLVFRAEGEEPREVTEEERARAQRGYELLESWRTVPGAGDGGTIDIDVLRDWVRRAREINTADRRAAVGDQRIGHVLSGSTAGADGAWPHPAVRDIIEVVQSPELERGIEVGVYNSRGVVSKAPGEGGAQERVLAERYAGFAAATRDRWPRTAALLRRIADGYRTEAQREDQDAELREDLDP